MGVLIYRAGTESSNYLSADNVYQQRTMDLRKQFIHFILPLGNKSASSPT
jgi:hypothetical protein